MLVAVAGYIFIFLLFFKCFACLNRIRFQFGYFKIIIKLCRLVFSFFDLSFLTGFDYWCCIESFTAIRISALIISVSCLCLLPHQSSSHFYMA